MPSRRVLGFNPDQEIILTTNFFVQLSYTFYYTPNLLFPSGQVDGIKILNSTGPIRTIVAHSRWHVRCFVRE